MAIVWFIARDSANIEGPFTMSNIVGVAEANAVGAAIWGEEPDIPN